MIVKYWWVLIPVVIAGVRFGPRGLRNNNPGNIRHGSSRWVGARAVQTDNEFVQFTDSKYGIRAMAKILDSYAARGVVYLVDIIHIWAPANENNVRAYLESVERKSGIRGNERVSRDRYPQLMAAMIAHENGVNPFSQEAIKAGIALA